MSDLDFLTPDDEDFAAESINPILDVPLDADEETVAPSKLWKQKVEAGEVNGWEHPNRGLNPESRTKKKRKPGTKYHRSKITDKDMLVFATLEKLRLVTTKQMAIALGVSRSAASWRLNGLLEVKMIGQEKTAGMPVLWYLKSKGRALLREAYYDYRAVDTLHTAGSIKFSTLGHSTFVNQVAVQLIAGIAAVGKSEEITFLPAGIERIPYLVDETYIRSSWGKATYQKDSGSAQQANSGYEVQKRVLESIERSELKWEDAIAQNPSLWTVALPMYQRSDVKDFHQPDLVIDLEQYRSDFQPKSIAVEVELSSKVPSDLRQILRGFQKSMVGNWFRPYAKVVYVVKSDAIADAIKRVATELGMTPAQLTIVRFRDLDGKIFMGKSWEL